MSKMQSLFIIPDVHVPFHDKRAWKLVLKVIKARKPDKIIIMGDFADLYAVMSHQKSPEKRDWTLQKEADNVQKALDELDAVKGDAKVIYIEGNHENRFNRYISQRAPDLFGVTSITKLFDLDKRGYKVVPYGDYIRIGKIYYTHDTGKAGSNAHRSAELAFSDNAVIGHTHRMGFDVIGNVKGHAHVSAMFGWLGDRRHAEYMMKANAKRDWVLGFGTGWMKADGTTFLQPHPIVNYETVVDGVLYR